MKRNVTIVLSDGAARWLRVEAAKADMSVSQFVGTLVEQERERAERFTAVGERFLARKPRRLAKAGEALPSRAELHER